MDKKITLVTGGIKSGKSSWALKKGEENKGPKAFIATALPLDDEMKQKIKNHQKERGARWASFEEPKDINVLLKAISDSYDVILIDCLTLWLSNLVTVYEMSPGSIQGYYAEFIACIQRRDRHTIMVTNEVSMGIIPADSLSRSFQNYLGGLNREVASIADEVYCMIAGIPVKIKPTY